MHTGATSDRTGWWVRKEAISKQQASLLHALNTDGNHTIVVERIQVGGYRLYDGQSQRIIEAGNEPAAIDAMLDSIQARSSVPVRLHLRGFEPREGKGFTKSAELQLAGFGGEERTITATIEDKALSPDELKVMLAEKYDFKNIKIDRVSNPFLTERGEVGVDVDAEVTPMKGVRKLLLRFTVILREGVHLTQELLATIQGSILNAFRSGQFAGSSAGNLLLTATVVKVLERISGDIKYVQVRIRQESKDLYGDNNRDLRRGSRTAGQAT